MVLNAVHHQFWEHKGWINPTDPYDWFQGYFINWLGEDL